MTVALTAHKGVQIWVNAHDGSFFTEEDETRAALSAPSLEELKKLIDKQTARPKERHEGFTVDYLHHGITPVTVTSIFEERGFGGPRKRCWITSRDKDGDARRGKHDACDVYRDNPTNAQIKGRLIELDRDIAGLQEQFRALREQLESFDPKADEEARREREKEAKKKGVARA